MDEAMDSTHVEIASHTAYIIEGPNTLHNVADSKWHYDRCIFFWTFCAKLSQISVYVNREAK